MTNHPMNDNRDFLEALAEIAYIAGQNDYRVEDSREVISNLIRWALEFDELHRNTDWCEVDYLEAVDDFTYGKMNLNLAE